MIDEQILRSRLKRMIIGKSLRAIKREHFSFTSLGTLARIRDGIFPKSKRLRDAFGLTSLVEVARCPNCEKGAHTYKCQKKEKKPRVLKATQDLATMIAYMKFLRSRENNKNKCSKMRT